MPLLSSLKSRKNCFDGTEDAKAINRIIIHAKKHDISLIYPELDSNSLHIRAYADASFAGNRDLSSQLGIIATLCDKKQVRNHWLPFLQMQKS